MESNTSDETREGEGRSLRPRVVVLEPIHRTGIERLEASCDVDELTGPADPRLDKALAAADALIVRSTRIDDAILARGPRLRVLGRHGAGVDNIDLDAARDRGITVVNTPRSNTDSVAEYVITVALMLLKRVEAGSARLVSGGFHPQLGSLPGQVDRAGLTGREAAGTTLGLVGAGAIGRGVAARAAALGMVVSAYDPFLTDRQLTALGIAPVSSLEALLGTVDIVSLHVPGGAENDALIGAAELSTMRTGSFLINAARGNLVEVPALVQALESGHLAGCAVDVFDPEPPAPDHSLFGAPNAIVTPHMAAMTHEALRRMAEDVAGFVIDALDASRG